MFGPASRCGEELGNAWEYGEDKAIEPQRRNFYCLLSILQHCNKFHEEF